MSADLPPLRRHPLALGAALLCLTGCEREHAVRSYYAPLPSVPISDTAARELPQWKLPENWTELPGNSSMRVASFAIQDPQSRTAEVGIMSLPATGIDDAMYVNLLRSPTGLPPVDANELGPLVEEITVAGAPAKLFHAVDPASEQARELPGRIVVAKLVRGATSWYVKLSGDTSLVNEQLAPFHAFLDSLTFHPAPASAAQTASAGDTGHDPHELPHWTAPAHWQEVPAGAMLLTKFLLTGENDQRAEITVSRLQGDGGGLLANVNRWRGQLGLEPVSESDLGTMVSSLDVPNERVMLVDMTGSNTQSGLASRMMVAIVTRDAQTWYFKLFGDAALAEGERETFLQFLRSLDFSHAHD